MPDSNFLQKYSILHQIGSGISGRVFLAKHNNLERFVAIKFITCDNEDAKRVLHEVNALAKINHPNVLSIYDFGQLEDKFYIVLEYMEDGSLEDKINNGKYINEFEVWKYIENVCNGLQASLSLGVIHRDVKPANILLYNKCYAKIGDFGIAKPLFSNANLTQEGMILGTPSFMAPELAQTKQYSFKSDIYALGITAYYCLTKHQPFVGETIIQTLLRHATEYLDVPNTHNSSLEISSSLIIAKMLQKQPENRYDSYGDLRVDIENMLHNIKPKFATFSDGKQIYKSEQIATLAKKLKASTSKSTQLTYQKIYDNIVITSRWDIVTRKKYSTRQTHFVESLIELKSILQKYCKKNLVAIDLDYQKEKSIDIFHCLRDNFPQTHVVFITKNNMFNDKHMKKYCCSYKDLISHIRKHTKLAAREIDLSVINTIVEENSWMIEQHGSQTDIETRIT